MPSFSSPFGIFLCLPLRYVSYPLSYLLSPPAFTFYFFAPFSPNFSTVFFVTLSLPFAPPFPLHFFLLPMSIISFSFFLYNLQNIWFFYAFPLAIPYECYFFFGSTSFHGGLNLHHITFFFFFLPFFYIFSLFFLFFSNIPKFSLLPSKCPLLPSFSNIFKCL